jgi:MSHA pilin protein MshC
VSNPACSNAVRGFTLIELVTTVVILGILSAVAVPRMFDNQAFGQRGYVDEVASALRYAQKIAIASRCDVSVVIDAAGYTAAQRDTLINCNDPATGWGTPVMRSDGTNLAGTVPADITMAPPATLVFNSQGAVSNGNPPALSVGPFTLTVNQLSGRVTVTP